jgi:hypothetical protein
VPYFLKVGELFVIRKLSDLDAALERAVGQYPPDFKMAKDLLAQGANINAEGYLDSETLLSNIIMGYPRDAAMNPCMQCKSDECDECLHEYREFDSKFLPEIVRFFIENGYDISKDNNRFGGEALYALCWSSYDSAILDAAKILLDAGADPLYITEDQDTVLDVVNWKLSGCIPVDDSLELECLYTVLYDIMEAGSKGQDYSKIEWADKVIGRKIEKVFSCASTVKEALFAKEVNGKRYVNCFTSDIVVVCDGLCLRLTHYCHTYLNPYNLPTAMSELTPLFPSIIGEKITGIQFSTSLKEDSRRRRHGSLLEIALSNGVKIRVQDNGDQFDEEYCAWIAII